MKQPIRFRSSGGYRRFCDLWWRDWFRWLTVGWLRDIRAYWHRARYGWAPCDTWSLDYYINGVLGGALEHLAEHSCGAPCGYPDPAPTTWEPPTDCDQWQADLRRWAKAFQDAARDDYYEIHGENFDAWHADEDARRVALHAALKEIEPWWDALWD